MTALPHFAERTHARTEAAPGAAAGAVRVILRIEGLIVLGAAVTAYAAISGQWLLFALLFLAPDLWMLGYLVNRTIGAAAYNAGHSYIGPALLALAGVATGVPILYALALIWTAHIGFDRLLGYGLKYPAAFGVTHLGLKGKAAVSPRRQ